MSTWNDYSNTLEVVEALAEEIGLISNEEELSLRFDEEIIKEQILSNMDYESGKSFLDDSVMINEEFNNYVDSLYSNGELHEEQVNEYCYIGEHS